MWNILNFEISRMVNSRPKRHKVRREDFSATIDYVIYPQFWNSRMRERHSKRNQTIFGDYWLCKIPYKGISTLYLLYV